jgi:hypothetical protein
VVASFVVSLRERQPFKWIDPNCKIKWRQIYDGPCSINRPCQPRTQNNIKSARTFSRLHPCSYCRLRYHVLRPWKRAREGKQVIIGINAEDIDVLNLLAQKIKQPISWIPGPLWSPVSRNHLLFEQQLPTTARQTASQITQSHYVNNNLIEKTKRSS